jgi:hypothetical protein
MIKCLVILTMVVYFISLNSCVTSTTTKPTPLPKTNPIEIKTLEYPGSGPWVFALYSIKWDGTKVNVDIGVTNKFNLVNSLPYVFFVADAYGGTFQPSEGPRPAFCSGAIYPGETKVGTLTFTVNPMSGNIVLKIFDNGYLKTENLFNLGVPH